MNQGARGTARVLIIDDESIVRETVQAIIESCQIVADTCHHPSIALENADTGISYDTIFLDVNFPDANGLDFLPKLQARFPGVKIIMVTGILDKDNAIRALKLGAFDYLEKPFDYAMLQHALQRALDAKEKEDRLSASLQELSANEAQLLQQNQKLEFLNGQLLKTNKAMAVLAQNIAQEREETEIRIATQLRGIVMPLIERLSLSPCTGEKIEELKTALNHLIEDLTSGNSLSAGIVSALSFTELRVASLIKSGLTSEEIAKQLHIAIGTVKTHRRNIRKKLNLGATRTDLRSYLASFRQELPTERWARAFNRADVTPGPRRIG